MFNRNFLNRTCFIGYYNQRCSIKMSNNPEPKVISISPIGSSGSAYLKPIRLNYTLDGNKQLAWDCVKAHDSVGIILFNKDRKKLIYVKQFRPSLIISSAKNFDLEKGTIEVDPAINGYTLEMCAGIIDKPGLTIEQIAKEEVLEETGYDIPVSSLQFVCSSRSSVGLQASLHAIYFAEVTDSQQKTLGGGIDNERIEVVELTIEESRKLLWCHDRDSPYSRPAHMLLGLSWFLLEHYPKNYSS
ncbi:uridine diphosphate glucose pyrophosphatase NUDT14-like [Panonychus citri]|uniref:uridine diphosphate glucose pyrophosphatase NUDT14-like n=1 Tax=Panonychus citri TaxID=50023 RepID=UPI0023077540|nr:uridine diphosphate glucose pyrophosphatase NUDT14-like [Panonychus citri]XP_053206436.1 uridine diphosphate glucose pyrophosphatase NUDT14-like [Panonychus citri]